MWILCTAHVFHMVGKIIAESGYQGYQVHFAILNAHVNSKNLLKMKNLGKK